MTPLFWLQDFIWCLLFELREVLAQPRFRFGCETSFFVLVHFLTAEIAVLFLFWLQDYVFGANSTDYNKHPDRLTTSNTITNSSSSSLSNAAYFTGVKDDKYCSPHHRYEKLLNKLRVECDRDAVVCLQEVSLKWTGGLHAFFHERDYTMVISNYGKPFNGYMGVAVAFPKTRFALADAQLICVADTKTGGWGARPERQFRNYEVENNTQLMKQVVSKVKLIARTIGGLFKLVMRPFWQAPVVVREVQPREAQPWDTARSRMNTMVCLRLRPTGGDVKLQKDFLVATYHMPCIFMEPSVMSIHTALCFQKLQALSEGKYPYILAGDFNFKPKSPQYAFVTTGMLPTRVDDPADPVVHGKETMPAEPAYKDDPFKFHLVRGPLQSAYAKVNGGEPLFTNYARTDNAVTTFSSTLDYLFYGNGEKFKGETVKLMPVSVVEVDETCKNILAEGLLSLPSNDEPSDHLLIGAEFDLIVEKTEKE